MRGSHRGTLHNALKHRQYLGLTPEDRLALILAGSTVGSVRDLIAALTAGASIHPFDVRVSGFDALADWIREGRLTYINMVMTLFRHFMAALPASARFPSVRVVRAGSERMAPVDLEAFRRHFPSTAVFYTGLGTTETGSVTGVLFSASTPTAEGRRRSRSSPPGHGGAGPRRSRPSRTPRRGGRDRGAQPVSGPRLLASPGSHGGRVQARSRGRRRPDLPYRGPWPTAWGREPRALGRRDDQVKVRCQRVVLSEVEQALLALPRVKQAAVTIRERRAGEPKMVGYVAMSGEPSRPEDLRRALRAHLPGRMIPAVFVTLPVLPSTPGGKLDRRGLPEPDWERSAPGTSPRTPLEARLATRWAEALGVDAVGVTDTFVSLGGDSLLAMRLVATICAELQLSLRPSALLAQAPGVRARAASRPRATTRRRAQAAGSVARIAARPLRTGPRARRPGRRPAALQRPRRAP